MSCKIYCIEDINGLKYVGSTIQKYLCDRLSSHTYQKRVNTIKKCSSQKLDLENCEIKLLEECDISHRYEKEKYWIDKIDCVNILKNNFDQCEYNINKYHYQKTWGGDSRNNNNLLKISLDIFSYNIS